MDSDGHMETTDVHDLDNNVEMEDADGSEGSEGLDGNEV